MTSSEYWEKRVANETWKIYNSIEQKNKALIEYYVDMSKEIRMELYDLAEKYSDNGVLSRTEMYRQNKLKKLETSINDKIKGLGYDVENFATVNMKDGIKQVYDATATAISEALTVPEFGMIEKQISESIMTKEWHGSNFSKRLWENQKRLSVVLNGVLKNGIQTGINVTQMASEINTLMGAGFKRAHRLVRTETMHMLNQAALERYKEAGIEKLEYLAAEDERTCEQCGPKNGKTYEVGKEPTLPLHPNCRCTYLPVIESTYHDKNNEGESGKIESLRIGENDVNFEYTNTEEYSRKFSRITNNSAVNNSIRKYAKAMLTHRTGTDGEDLYIIDSTNGKLIYSNTKGANDLGVEISKVDLEKIHRSKNIIGIHNHPTNLLPTGSDFVVSGSRKYDVGVVIAHNGNVFTYKAGKEPFRSEYLNKRVDKYTDYPYNYSIDIAQKKVLNEFVEEYGIEWSEIT